MYKQISKYRPLTGISLLQAHFASSIETLLGFFAISREKIKGQINITLGYQTQVNTGSKGKTRREEVRTEETKRKVGVNKQS